MTNSVPEETAAGAAYDPFLAGAEQSRAGVEAGLLRTLRVGLDRHAEVRAAIGLDGDPPEDADLRAERVHEYRRVVTSELLDPVALHFRNRGPASGVADDMSGALSETVEAVRALPEVEERSWGAGAMVTHARDGVRRGLLKFVARIVRTGRRPEDTRPVPVRAVTERHLQDHLLPAVDDAALRAAVAWGRWGRELERVWAAWAGATLPLLVRSRRLEGEELEEMWTGVREAAARLHLELEELLAGAPDAPAREAMDETLTPMRARLDGDLSVAGSFVYSPSPVEASEWLLPRLARIRPALGTLDHGVAARLSLYSAILGVLAGASSMRVRLLRRFEKECLEPIRALGVLAERMEALRTEVPDSGGTAAMRAELEALRERVRADLEPSLEEVPAPEIVSEIVEEGGRGISEALGALVSQLPETVVLTEDDVRVHPRLRKVDTRELPLRLLARQAFDVLRVERIANVPRELQEAVERLRANVDELERVFGFAIDSALQELGADDAGNGVPVPEESTEADEVPTDPVEHASRLVSDSLQNIADSLRGEVAELNVIFQVTGTKLSEELTTGALGLVERVAAGGVQAQVFAAWSGLVTLRAWASERWGPRVSRLSKAIRYAGLRGRRLWRRWTRAGRRALAGSPTEEVASTRLVRLLSEAQAMMRTLPPVYQRLFTLDPVAEPSLLIGREAVLADTLARVDRLEQGEGDCIVFRALPGAGLTSFLYALASLVQERGHTVAQVSPVARLADEAAWAAMLADALGLDAPDCLDVLAEAILEKEPGVLPALVTIDNMEHLFLRAPGGAELIADTLAFIARTEDRICWVGGITRSAWQQVETQASTAAAMIDHEKLPPLTAAEIRTAVTTRHRRSGLPVRYQEPRGRRLLERRIRRANSPEAVRSILAEDFFDQLSRTSGGDLRLALFQWLRCCDFEQGDGLLIRPPARPDYSALDSLSWTEAFTLKAFLDHRTLTLAEHDAVFRLPREESANIFESLVNRRLIGHLGTGPIDTSPGSEQRFRIHRLLVGAVSEHLRGRNVVH